MKRRGRAIALLSVAATLSVIAIAAAIAWRQTTVRTYLTKALLPPATLPAQPSGNLRLVLLRERDDAATRGDLQRVAIIHANLAQEASLRALAAQKHWLAKQDPRTHLFAESSDNPAWNYRNVAADCFGFLFQATARLDPLSLPKLQQTFDAESKLAAANKLPHPVDSRTLETIEESHEQALFGASEYVKDGLLSVYEHLGPDAAGAAGQRMLAVLDTVIAECRHSSPGGMLPGEGSEVNGNVLQACARLSFATGRDDYVEMAARIADAAVTQMLAANGGLPGTRFDYSTNRNTRGRVKLRDHGSEITPGLSEAFALAVARSHEPRWKDRAARWAESLAQMYETLLAKGVNADGLLRASLDPESTDEVSVTDNWGYILNGVLLFTQAARRQGQIDASRLDALDQRVDAIVAAVAKTRGIDWEEGRVDGYADSLESGLYMAGYHPRCASVILPWVDDQMGIFYAYQRADGQAAGNYLDGNFIRTAMMYAEQKSGGFRVDPFREDVRVGFATDSTGHATVVVMTSQPYEGTLHPDTPRHQQFMKLPWNWPRLNSWPEWFTITDRTRIISADGITPTPTPAHLAAGLPLKLPANAIVTLRLRQ